MAMLQMTPKDACSHPMFLAASERVNWRVEDLINETRQLDFARPFLPESLGDVYGLAFLGERERLVLNQLRGHGYLHLFGLVEELIMPFVLDHTRPELHELARTRALIGDETKHVDLFHRFREAFLDGFGHDVPVVEEPQTLAAAILARRPLAVGLLILHLEWMTQTHWLESTRDDENALDPQFKDLLRHHWMEEAQHAKLDELMVEALAARRRSSAAIDRAIDDYLEIVGLLDTTLAEQVELDLATFETATGRHLDERERAQVRAAQLQANRWTFLGSGMTHPRFLAALQRLSPRASSRVAAATPAFVVPAA
jgi:hypothetical protein